MVIPPLEESAKRQLLRLLIVASAVALFLLGRSDYLSSFDWLRRAWTNDPQYSHGWVLGLVCAGLVYYRFRRFGRAFLGDFSLPVSVVWFLAGTVAWFVGRNWHAAFLIILSFLFLIQSVVSVLSVVAERRTRWPVLLILCAVPLPYWPEFTVQLQVFVTQAASGCLSMLGIPTWAEGSLVHLPSETFRIVAGCSGSRSLLALLSLCLIGIGFSNDSAAAKWIVALLSFPAAVLSNIARVLLVLAVGHRWGSEKAVSIWHDWSGPFFFLFAAACLVVVWITARRTFPRRLQPSPTVV